MKALNKMKNMHAKKRCEVRQYPDYGKTIVVGACGRARGAVRAQTVEVVDKETPSAFIGTHAVPSTTIYTDEGSTYRNITNHESGKHSKGKYIQDDGVSTNGMESF